MAEHHCKYSPATGIGNCAKLRQTISEGRCENSDERPVSESASAKRLPEFEHFLTGQQVPSVRPITELGDSSDAVDSDQLETERAEFQDTVPRFQQNVAWSSASNTQSSSAAFDGKNNRYNQSANNSCSNSSEQYKFTELAAIRVNETKDNVVDSNSHASVSQSACSAVSATDDVNLSRVLQQLSHLSQQLDAQVTADPPHPHLASVCNIACR